MKNEAGNTPRWSSLLIAHCSFTILHYSLLLSSPRRVMGRGKKQHIPLELLPLRAHTSRGTNLDDAVPAIRSRLWPLASATREPRRAPHRKEPFMRFAILHCRNV